MRVAGVDDAGRGAVIGPLTIAGLVVDYSNLPALASLGVKDSKLLSPRRREQLADEINTLALEIYIVRVTPAEIDKVVETGKKLHRLNRLEAQTMAKVIQKLRPDRAYVDASDVQADRFGRHIAEDLPFPIEIVSEHKADARFPIVSAASILAKVDRDSVVTRLRRTQGDLGSGYPADNKTIRFLEDCIRDFGRYPDFVRKSWKPAKRIKREVEAKQTKLG